MSVTDIGRAGRSNAASGLKRNKGYPGFSGPLPRLALTLALFPQTVLSDDVSDADHLFFAILTLSDIAHVPKASAMSTNHLARHALTGS